MEHPATRPTDPAVEGHSAPGPCLVVGDALGAAASSNGNARTRAFAAVEEVTMRLPYPLPGPPRIADQHTAVWVLVAWIVILLVVAIVAGTVADAAY
jgi:hypothetical protein